MKSEKEKYAQKEVRKTFDQELHCVWFFTMNHASNSYNNNGGMAQNLNTGLKIYWQLKCKLHSLM